MTNSFFGGMPQQKGVAPQATPSPTQSLNNQVDPIKRAKFSGYLEGMSANAMPQQPPMTPMMPPQMPMPMMGGGEVDVFDPMYMNQGGFVIQTDDSGKIATRPVYDAEKGRMVSQILSRGMVDEMKQAAQKPMVTVESEPESKLVAIRKMLEDDYESGRGFADTMQPVTTESTISLPTPKPKIQIPVSKPKIQLPVSKPEFSDIKVPVSKPDIASILRDIDEAEELRDAAKYLVTSPRTPVKQGVDFVLDDLALYQETPYKYEYSYDPSGILNRGSQEEENNQSIIIPSAFAGDIESEVEKKEKDQGIGLLAMFLNAIRPRYTTESAGFEEIGGEEEFPPSDVIRSSRFNDGGIVQGFSNGGFTSNIKLRDDDTISGRAEKIVDRYNRASTPKVKEIIIDRAGPELEPIARGMLGGYDPGSAGDEMGSENPAFAPMPNIDAEERAAGYMLPQKEPKEFTDLRNVQSSTPLTIGNLPIITSKGGAPDNMFGFNRFTKPIIDMLGYDTSTPAGAGEYYADTARSLDRYEQGQIQRKKDQDRAEAKLAEEQRLRDMIAGMMPQQTPITPNPIVDPSPPTIPSDPSDVVIPSTRIPNFDMANLSPYPTFGVPGTGTYPAVIPSGITPELLKNLFTMQGVPATTMQEGGSVNKLDTAIDDFLGSMRSVA